MLTDRQLFDLFSEAVIEQPADPTFLDELFEVLRDEVQAAGLVRIPSDRRATRVRRGFAVPATLPAWAAVAVAAAIVLVAASLVLRFPSVGPSPAPGGLTETFRSPLGGYTIGYAPGSDVRPATRIPDGSTHTWVPDDPWVDLIQEPGGRGAWDILSVPIPSGITPEQWLADQQAADLLGGSGLFGCGPTLTTEPVSIDGVAASIDTHCPSIGLTAEVIAGSRGYIFDLRSAPVDMAWFRTVLSTIHLDPASAASPTPAPTLPVEPAADLTTFTSTRYGYTIGYPSNWSVRPASTALDQAASPLDQGPGTDVFGATVPIASEPALIVASSKLAPGTTLPGWTTSRIALAQATRSCEAPETNVPITIAGLPAALMTWPACPGYLMWAVFVRDGVGYELAWTDGYATDNPAQQDADRVTFQRLLSTVRIAPATP